MARPKEDRAVLEHRVTCEIHIDRDGKRRRRARVGEGGCRIVAHDEGLHDDARRPGLHRRVSDRPRAGRVTGRGPGVGNWSSPPSTPKTYSCAGASGAAAKAPAGRSMKV